jgi:hypothetical protein
MASAGLRALARCLEALGLGAPDVPEAETSRDSSLAASDLVHVVLNEVDAAETGALAYACGVTAHIYIYTHSPA